MKIQFKKTLPWIGWLGFILCLGFISMVGYSRNTTMNEQASTYKTANTQANNKASTLTPEKAAEAIKRISDFLSNIGSEEYIEQEIANVYSKDAYFNDTLKSLVNRDEIKEHFTKTAITMTSYSLEIDDIASTDKGHYLRWTMKFSAPKLAKGEDIITVGMSHIIFDEEGKVLLHQDFWDSASGLFEHIPLVGSGIRLVKKRL